MPRMLARRRQATVARAPEAALLPFPLSRTTVSRTRIKVSNTTHGMLRAGSAHPTTFVHMLRPSDNAPVPDDLFLARWRTTLHDGRAPRRPRRLAQARSHPFLHNWVWSWFGSVLAYLATCLSGKATSARWWLRWGGGGGIPWCLPADNSRVTWTSATSNADGHDFRSSHVNSFICVMILGCCYFGLAPGFLLLSHCGPA